MDTNTSHSSPASRRKAAKMRVKRLSVCAMLCALGVVALYLGSLVEVLDLCTAALGALLLIPVTVEYGKGYPWGIYAATSALSMILLPNKIPAAVYLLFGYYPILKAYLERLRPWICRLLKLLLFAAVTGAALAFSYLIAPEATLSGGYYAALYALALVTLIVFDLALRRLITLYLLKYHPRVSTWMR